MNRFSQTQRLDTPHPPRDPEDRYRTDAEQRPPILLYSHTFIAGETFTFQVSEAVCAYISHPAAFIMNIQFGDTGAPIEVPFSATALYAFLRFPPTRKLIVTATGGGGLVRIWASADPSFFVWSMP